MNQPIAPWPPTAVTAICPPLAGFAPTEKAAKLGLGH